MLKNKKRLIIIAVLIILAVVVVFMVKSKSGGIPVKEISVQNVVVKKTISASGFINSMDIADLAFSASGPIASVRVSKGDEVSRGQVLAVLDTAALNSSAQAAKDARDIALRNKELFVEQYVNDKDLVGGKTEYDIKVRTLDEQISQAQANYSASVSQLDNAYIYAPFTGTVTDISKKQGEVATAGSPVIKLADLNQLVFEVTLDQGDFGLLTESEKVEVVLDSYPDEVYEGQITELPIEAQTSSSGNKEFVVKINVSNGHGKPILLGMTGDANIIVDSTENEVPALFFDEISTDENDNEFVWIVENGLIKKLTVETGLEGDLYIQLSNVPEQKIVIPAAENIEMKEGSKAIITP